MGTCGEQRMRWEETSQNNHLMDYYANQGNPNTPAPKPDNYLVWAILSTICCCLPFGIVAIVYASKVDSYYATNQVQLAYDASSKAKNWIIAAAATGVVIDIIYFLVYGLSALAAFS